jgi:hypothetical protein
MQREAIFETWAPPGGVWSLWARPILFAQMPESGDPGSGSAGEQPVRFAPQSTRGDMLIPEVYARGQAVLVVDLPGEESVWAGLALAGLGYRPVPLYNVCTGPAEVIHQGPIIAALRAGAEHLASLTLTDAPPAFLLDARRMGGGVIRPGDFDNRWQVFPQDFPSAAFLTARGIMRALLIQRGRLDPHEDLAHVLRRWQEAGITIEARDVTNEAPPVPITVGRPAWYRSAWQRVLAILGLRRGSHGGFGGFVPKPSHG